MKAELLTAFAMWISELEAASEYDSANCGDDFLKDLVKGKKPKSEDLFEAVEHAVDKLKDHEQDLDDGLFGLNDPEKDPVSKAV